MKYYIINHATAGELSAEQEDPSFRNGSVADLATPQFAAIADENTLELVLQRIRAVVYELVHEELTDNGVGMPEIEWDLGEGWDEQMELEILNHTAHCTNRIGPIVFRPTRREWLLERPMSCERCGATSQLDPSCGKSVHLSLPDEPEPARVLAAIVIQEAE